MTEDIFIIDSNEDYLNKVHEEISLLINDDVNYIEAILYYADINNIEIEVIAEMVKKMPYLKSLIQFDAESLHFLEPSDTCDSLF